MAVKFHLCLLLIILGGMAANFALARKSVSKKRTAHVALAGKQNIYSLFSKESIAHLCVECRQRKNGQLLGAFDFIDSFS